MVKKAKGKGKAKGKSKEKQLEIPPEWVGKSVEELKVLVSQLEYDLDVARTSRNRAQVEHGSIQSYYDVTREQIRELDMQIEKKNLEIENTEEDNATELRVYDQKANFIKYCHDNKLKEVFDDNEAKMNDSSTNHAKDVEDLEATKRNTRVAMIGAGEQHTSEICNLQRDNKMDISLIKEKLDADVKLFEQKCDDQQAELQKELDSRQDAELHIVDSRKDFHLKDLSESHQHRCNDMRVYFEGVERQQQIDIEDLEAEIRRLTKAAIENESSSSYLKDSNERCGNELTACSVKVTTLECKTKDKEKNANSLKTTNARLSVARKAIVEARIQYKQLQEKYGMIEEERDSLRKGTQGAASEACKTDRMKQDLLHDKMREQRKSNDIIEQHLQHIARSAALDRSKTDVLISNLHEFIQQNSQEMEKLNLVIATTTKEYNTCRSELLNHGVSEYSNRRSC